MFDAIKLNNGYEQKSMKLKLISTKRVENIG